jgi:hypothetical protein
MRRYVVACALGLLGCRDSGAGGRPTDAGGDAASARDLAAEADCPADAQGGGLCPINFCGYVKSAATLGLTEVAQAGADSLCSDGRSCVATLVVPTGDAIQLTCVAPQPGAVAYGTACTTGAGSAARCKDDSLCIAAADFPGAPFCSQLCRIDADCPASSYCLDYRSPPLPNQSYAPLGMCTPKAKINQTFCQAEADCPVAQGCVLWGGRTALLVCKAGGAKSLGTACVAGSECRSGDCFDRDFHLNGGDNRTFCSGICAKNSDCGPAQICVQEVVSNNGTPSDPRDDLVVGYCQSLYTSTAAAACPSDQACVTAAHGADTCHPTYGLCYSSTAAIGAACAYDDACGLGVSCVTGPTFQDGACLLSGCSRTSTAAADQCPGARAVCSQRAPDQPLYRCYEGCVNPGDCLRGSENYFCAVAQDSQTIATICLSR